MKSYQIWHSWLCRISSDNLLQNLKENPVLNLKSFSIVTVFLLVTFVSFPANSEVKISPFIGFSVPTTEINMAANRSVLFSFVGNSAQGIDISFGSLPFDIEFILTYITVGSLGREYELDLNEHVFGAGLQRGISLGKGSIELSASYMFRDETYIFELWNQPDSKFGSTQNGVMFGAQLLAPFSDKIDLALVTKLAVTSDFSLEAVSENQDQLTITRPGTTFILAAGLNFRLGW